MNCGHCGSKCSEQLPGELNKKEALQLCDQLVKLGLKQVTLSGGEPFMRKDWHHIAKCLSSQGVKVNAISNGWFVDETLLDMALESGMSNIGISLDGIEETHDLIRMPGSFKRITNSLKLMQKRGFPTAIVTTIMKTNISMLSQIYKHLELHGVELWQIQLGLPMGNLSRDNIIKPEQVHEIITFTEGIVGSSSVKILLADSIGYYSKQLARVSESFWGKTVCWAGCQAGKSSFGILHDGSIIGCASIRQPSFIEGNIRQVSLHEIWNRSGAFAWNRDFSVKDLSGFCRVCRYNANCLGGCSNSKLVMTGGLSDNPYCIYRCSIEHLLEKVNSIFSKDTLMQRAKKAISLEMYEIAERCLDRLLQFDPNHIEAMKLWGYVWFKIGDFSRCLEINQRALSIAPDDVFVNKGLGISLAKMGFVQEGIKALQKAITLTSPKYVDPYYDLAVVLMENNRFQEAIDVLNQGRLFSPDFIAISEPLYQTCLEAQKADAFA